MTGTIIQLNSSPGGMPKLPIASGHLTKNGLADDWQKDRVHHGGPSRAVCLFSTELYDWLRAEHQIDLKPGMMGENLTTTGLDLQQLTPGDCLQAGPCTIRITKVRTPCYKLRRWHPNLDEIIEGHSGWMARVLVEGTLTTGDPITLMPREQHTP